MLNTYIYAISESENVERKTHMFVIKPCKIRSRYLKLQLTQRELRRWRRSLFYRKKWKNKKKRTGEKEVFHRDKNRPHSITRN